MKMTNIINWINSESKGNNNQIDPLAMLDWEIKSQEWNLVDDYKKQLEEYQKKITPIFIEKKKKTDENWKMLERIYKDFIEDNFFQSFLDIEKMKTFERYPELYLKLYNKYLSSLINEAIVMTSPIIDTSESEFKKDIKNKIYKQIVEISWFKNWDYYKTRTLENNPNMWIYKDWTDRSYFLENSNFYVKDLKILWNKEIINIIFKYLKPYIPTLDNMEKIQSKLFWIVKYYFKENNKNWIIILWEFKLRPRYREDKVNVDNYFLKTFNNIVSFLKTFTNNKVNRWIFEKIEEFIENNDENIKILEWTKRLVMWSKFLYNIGLWDIFEEIILNGKQDPSDKYFKKDRIITMKVKISSKIKSKLNKRIEQLKKEKES